MADRLSKSERSENMRRIRSKDMRPEIAVRKIVHAMGYRYRLHRAGLPGKPDLVFVNRKAVIFVHGCFWHQHAAARCPIVRQPKSNGAYWTAKLKRNNERDIRNARRLRAMGWRVLTIWECDIRYPERVRRRVESFLER